MKRSTSAEMAWPGSLLISLILVGTLVSACDVLPMSQIPTEILTPGQQIESQPTNTSPPPVDATEPVQSQVLINELLDYCFAYPDDFTSLTNDGQVEVVGPHSASGPQPGLLWIDSIDAQGRTAQDVAEEEIAALGGTPPRSTVALGDEEALVLDGMPGQDPIRKVYIVHAGHLYTLNFSPDSMDNPTAKAQMETLFAIVTSSWVWISSGTQCPLQ